MRARQEVVDLGCWSCGRVSEVGDIADRQNLRELFPTSIQPWWLPFGSDRAARFTSFFALLYPAIQLLGFFFFGGLIFSLGVHRKFTSAYKNIEPDLKTKTINQRGLRTTMLAWILTSTKVNSFNMFLVWPFSSNPVNTITFSLSIM